MEERISSSTESAEVLLGRKLRELRTRKGLSLRALAERSGLNVNTLSLIENGRSSPSVSTLQQLSLALGKPIAVFFEAEALEKQVVFTPADQRPLAQIGKTTIQNLGKELAGSAVQPFAVTIQPGSGSGSQMIVHTGYEFVYCLCGSLHYRIDQQDYHLQVGDSLVFEAHQPHCWENTGSETAQILLIFYPADEHEQPDDRHFSQALIKKELNMKVAVITDDGKTISQHFGRAPYYLVLTIEEGQVVSREMRDKMGHTHFSAEPHTEAHDAPGHGQDAASHDKHVNMAQAIADCKALICGGMGMGAYESMRQLNIQPLVTEERNIDKAVQEFIDGKLIDHTELLH